MDSQQTTRTPSFNQQNSGSFFYMMQHGANIIREIEVKHDNIKHR
jgi:hypothetical protein